MKKNVLIIGGSGQFGITLAKKLNNYKNVIITTRNISKTSKKIGNSKNIKVKKLNILSKIEISKIISNYKPAMIFYFAGQSSPKISFLKRNETISSNFIGCKNFLETIYDNKLKTKFLNASSSEIFMPSKFKLNLNSKKEPISPYGIAKLKSFNITKNYRIYKNLKTYNAIIFNTESTFREKNYIIPKICIAAIKAKKEQTKTSFGDLNVIREWNWCDEQCDYMLKFISKEPQDFILSNNKPFSAKQMLDFAFKYFNLDFRKFVKTSKLNFRKKDFKVRLSNNKNIFKKNNIKFNYKIYGQKLIIKLLEYYLKKDFLKKKPKNNNIKIPKIGK
tara:strand:+ start:56 stop:1054 length:999 start_codon:yes stop_codon:yes gene_type:complete